MIFDRIRFSFKLLTERLMPTFIYNRWKILRQDKETRIKRIKIIDYLKSQDLSKDSEEYHVLDFLQKNPLSVFPDSFINSYSISDIKVYFDNKLKLPYVFLEGKKLFFKENMSPMEVRYAFRSLLIEQDMSSPHRYLAGIAEKIGGKIAVDVGAAEGIFALMIIDYFETIYLFETDPSWINPLKATFAPYGNKIVIVNKFMDKIDDSDHCSFDKFFAMNKTIDLLKIDVDGAERSLLQGASRSLNDGVIEKILICTYHNDNDETEFQTILSQYGYQTELSKGHMLFYHDPNFAPPYLRRGLIRAYKTKE